jgi:hypothetical protein
MIINLTQYILHSFTSKNDEILKSHKFLKTLFNAVYYAFPNETTLELIYYADVINLRYLRDHACLRTMIYNTNPKKC